MMNTLLKLTGLVFGSYLLMAGSVQAAEAPVNVCVSSSGRIVYVQDEGEDCPRGYDTVTLGVEGPQGEAGMDGNAGPAGPTGPAGADSTVAGPAGADGVDAADDPDLQADLLELFARIEALEALVPSYEIGDEGPGGGIVFYVDPNDATIGLEAALADQDNAQWCSIDIDILDVDNLLNAATEDMNSGAVNTPLIEDVCGASSAAGVAAAHVWPNGQSDGFLPNKEQLNSLFLQKDVVGGFADDYYWSSSEFSAYIAWFQYFNFGFQDAASKDFTGRVRAVRAF